MCHGTVTNIKFHLTCCRMFCVSEHCKSPMNNCGSLLLAQFFNSSFVVWIVAIPWCVLDISRNNSNPAENYFLKSPRYKICFCVSFALVMRRYLRSWLNMLNFKRLWFMYVCIMGLKTYSLCCKLLCCNAKIGTHVVKHIAQGISHLDHLQTLNMLGKLPMLETKLRSTFLWKLNWHFDREKFISVCVCVISLKSFSTKLGVSMV